MMEIKNSIVIFESTGLELYANGGKIGINPDLETSEGYDGNFNKGWGDDFHDIPFTQAEREELGDFMIGLWQKFKVTETSGE